MADSEYHRPSAISRSLKQPPLFPAQRGLCPVTHADFLQDVGDVVLHRALGEAEFQPNLAVAQTLGEQPQHVAFALGERLSQTRIRGTRGRRQAGGTGPPPTPPHIRTKKPLTSHTP